MVFCSYTPCSVQLIKFPAESLGRALKNAFLSQRPTLRTCFKGHGRVDHLSYENAMTFAALEGLSASLQAFWQAHD